jgi:hypothetical protein
MQSNDAQPDETGSKPLTAEESPKSNRAFSGVTRALSDEELDSPGVRKLLLELIQRAEEDISILKSFRDRFYEADKRNGILEQKLRTNKAAEAFSMGTLATGGTAVGLAPTFWSFPHGGGVFVLVFGIALILVAVGTKVYSR